MPRYLRTSITTLTGKSLRLRGTDEKKNYLHLGKDFRETHVLNRVQLPLAQGGSLLEKRILCIMFLFPGLDEFTQGDSQTFELLFSMQIVKRCLGYVIELGLIDSTALDKI